MTSLLLPVVTGESSSAERLHVVVAAYLARYRGLSRQHTASDLRVFLVWCDERGLDPLAARRAHLERYVRWCQEVRRFRPSTVSRRTWVVCGFYRTCVIDGLLEHSPAQWLRRPTVPPESPHPRTDAPAVRGAADRGPRVDQTATTSPWSRCSPARAAHLRGLRRRRQRPGEGHGHRVLRVVGKGTKVVLVPFPPAVGRAIDRAVDGRAEGPVLRNRRGGRMDRHAATRRLRHLADDAGVRLPRMHPHMLRHTFVPTTLPPPTWPPAA